jgi:hypothetical protein
LLSDLDSHGIYDAAMLDECEFDTSCVPVESQPQVWAQIQNRGLGGDLTDNKDARLISGYKVATALAREYLGDAPGLAFHGRGSSFRADFAALEKAGH